ncbi:hypothetical protein HBI17_011670 [Parastagonospora nodorum]|nr:hypothetical protein HBI74_148910 [Parastagonospora nodorum]KAH5283137.1 hypothetical protein HBI72_001950 [Parastagonospora nodorum]KAH5653804.1 hypothetical protein HBI51_059050 [Parastagonospora nodorum]KAH5703449.1 hypothetical protein HBI44_015850 [Parastagonospora nodorum]KAH5771787.1 hypothetical protein HBI17_011670 [Parastagonospora nodorum]
MRRSGRAMGGGGSRGVSRMRIGGGICQEGIRLPRRGVWVWGREEGGYVTQWKGCKIHSAVVY